MAARRSSLLGVGLSSGTDRMEEVEEEARKKGGRPGARDEPGSRKVPSGASLPADDAEPGA